MPPLQAMRDRCKIMTAGTPTGGEPTPAYTVGSEIRCRFSRVKQFAPTFGEEVEGGAVVYQPMLMLPRGTVITSLDRVRMTQIGRTSGLSKEYAVDGEPVQPQDGREEIIVPLKRLHEAA